VSCAMHHRNDVQTSSLLDASDEENGENSNSEVESDQSKHVKERDFRPYLSYYFSITTGA
jgi:hypothetical protein